MRMMPRTLAAGNRPSSISRRTVRADTCRRLATWASVSQTVTGRSLTGTAPRPRALPARLPRGGRSAATK